MSTKHGSTYADYSHGLRLVSAIMRLDDTLVDLSDALRERGLYNLLSDEGPIDACSILAAP